MYANRSSMQDLIVSRLPLVTAVVTTCNRPQLAQRAVQSVLAQTYKRLEIIVVEDGSDSGVEAWLEKKDRVCYIRHEENQGLAAARNTGLQHANGEYIAYLDDDDEWMPQMLYKQIDLAREVQESCAVTYCGAFIVSPEGNVVTENMPRLRGDIRGAIRKEGLFTIPSSCLFRRKVLENIAGYDTLLTSHIDHDIWLQLARAGYAAEYVNECLVNVHRLQGNQMTSDTETRIQATKAFCEKWRPEMTEWWGEGTADKYCSEFKARVMGMLGWSLVERGQRKKGAICFSSAIRQQPKQREHYQGMVACTLGKYLYDNLMQFLKRFL